MYNLDRSPEIWDEYIFTGINLRGAFSGTAALVYSFNTLFLDLVHFPKRVIRRRKGGKVSVFIGDLPGIIVY